MTRDRCHRYITSVLKTAPQSYLIGNSLQGKSLPVVFDWEREILGLDRLHSIGYEDGKVYWYWRI